MGDVEIAVQLCENPDDSVKLAQEKARLLWESGKTASSVKFLEDSLVKFPALKPTFEYYKVQYKSEFGLEYGDPTAAKIEAFANWMHENGARFPKIRMRYYGPDYRGVHSVKPIGEDEVFLWVPKKLIITAQMGRETEMGAKIIASGVSLSWDYLVYITTFLLVQQFDQESWWKPYMDVYPKTVDSFPMFFKEEEKELLKGSPMYDQIKSEIDEAKAEYDKIVAAVPEFAKFPFEAYLRNKTLVISRIFFVNINGTSERIMVPLAGTACFLYINLSFRYV